MRDLPFVSVIIPVFNDGESLSRCLGCLEAQSYPRERFEIIVVDNGSPVPPVEAVERVPIARLLMEEKAGSYSARNRGLDDAKGEIIAFTDADCRPDPLWLETGVRHLVEVNGCDYLAGRIELEYRDPSRLSAAEIYESMHAFRQKGYIEQVGFGATANLFVRRSVFDRVGRFDEQLRSGGDMELGRRVLGAGLRQAYSHETVVRHDARRRYLDLRRRELRKVGGLLPNLRQKRGLLMSILMVLCMPSRKLMMDGSRPATLKGFRNMALYVLVVGALRVGRSIELLRLLTGGAPRR